MKTIKKSDKKEASKDQENSPKESSPKNKNVILNVLYTTVAGRIALKVLTFPVFSKFVGFLLDTRLSKPLIIPFKLISHINMKEYERKHYKSFNDFFTRQIKPGKRPIDKKRSHLISPCDGRISAYKIEEDLMIPIKGTTYTLESILRNKALADEFGGGICVVIRLSVDNYHRYCYVDSGKKGKNVFVKGVLHTVNPIAFKYFNIFKENCREYTVIDTENFGKVIQMEVGALLVGRITNYHGKKKVKRGDEKGKFEYGGSTVVLFLKNDKLKLFDKFWINTANNIETPVKMGEAIGKLSK